MQLGVRTLISDATLPVAIVTAALLLILGCSMLFATRSWLALMSEYSEHPHKLLVPGMAAMVYGLIVVFEHNIWVRGWEVAITIAGWAILLKGLTFLFMPDTATLYAKFPESLTKMSLRVGGTILILLSIMLLLTFTGQT
ncbi:MAG TPA: hypothetical protein VJ984_13350 [Xanthomonadales bacterium]|nr:hypothetical protein [Xanthomonadales bacterium]